jgi:hypothetical protein
MDSDDLDIPDGLAQRNKCIANAFRLFVLGLPMEEIAERIDYSKRNVEKWAADQDWRGQREEIHRKRNLRLGVDVLKEQENVKRIEAQLHQDLIAAGTLALANFNPNPYVDKSGRKHPTPAEIAELIDLGTKLGRLATGMPLNTATVDIGVRHDLSDSIKLALSKVYGEPIEPIDPIKAIEVAAEPAKLENPQ